MRFSAVLTTALLVLSPAVSLADSVLMMGEGVQLFAHNGQKTSGDMLKVTDGQHQILVRYSADLSRRIDRSDLHDSDTWVLLFSVENQSVKIDVPRIRNAAQFNAFNRTGDWVLRADHGDIPFEKFALKKPGFQVLRNYEAELAEFNASNNPAALKIINPVEVDLKNQRSAANSVLSSTDSVIKKRAENTPEPNAPMAEEMLHYWYQAADKQTQLRFKNWINAQ